MFTEGPNGMELQEDVSLVAAKQQKNQMKLAFAAEGRGEAPKAAGGGTEAVKAGYGTESPASPECLMEEVCQRDNLVRALKRVKANKGSPGIDGMRVEELADYPKELWPRIREQLLQAAYLPQPAGRCWPGVLRLSPRNNLLTKGGMSNIREEDTF
ncbi:MAG: hypothetical protein ABSA09_02435 [Desulfobaccales bacterium]|jgi:RNA-directed DNA polymerase